MALTALLRALLCSQTLAGIFRAAQLRVNPRQRASHALFKTYLDVLHVAKDEADRLFRPRGAAGTQVRDYVQASSSGVGL